MTATPAAELRQAAQRLRELVAAVREASHTDWGDEPWRAVECAKRAPGEVSEMCPCIVAQGDTPLGKAFPLTQYVADAETEQHAAFIAALHPGVAVALADWLETAATYLGDEPQVTYPSHVVRALAVARQILGTPAAKEAHDA